MMHLGYKFKVTTFRFCSFVHKANVSQDQDFDTCNKFLQVIAYQSYVSLVSRGVSSV